MPTGLLLGFCATTLFAGAPRGDDFQNVVVPFVKTHCQSCHNAKKHNGDVNLTTFGDAASARADLDTWEKVLSNLRDRTMPPSDRPQPTAAEVEAVANWIDAAVAEHAKNAKPDPGQVTARRLNRVEYDNTVRDLLGVSLRLSDDFPSDDLGYGFDNIGDVLTLPPLLLEKYLTAAERAVDAALAKDLGKEAPDARKYSGRELRFADKNAPPLARGVRVRPLNTNGEVYLDHEFPKEGEYVIRLRLSGNQAGNEPVKAALKIDGKVVATFDVPNPEKQSKAYPHTQQMPKGFHRLSVAFLNDFWDAQGEEGKRDRNLHIQGMEVEGPKYVKPANEELSPRARLLIAEPNGIDHNRLPAGRILRAFLRRAYRRPPTGDEVVKLTDLVVAAQERGDSFEDAIKLGLQAAMVSPAFLFRIERDQPNADADGVAPVGDYELASRLSYFLWRSMPDEELFRLAGARRLRDPAIMESQARRMLSDPKASAFIENFVGQWLQLRNVKTIQPDRGKFPQFDEPLRVAMIREVELFAGELLKENKPIGLFLDADFTYVNGRLSQLYGISGAPRFSRDFVRVKLTDRNRGGVLTMAAVLTLTSNPTRTSPVKRGKFVLENLLGAVVPPPPPGVPELDADDKKELKGTLRQRLEQHLANPTCNSCHQRMDPLGFGLENFDAIGQFRTKDGREPIESSGTLPTGESFKGAAEMRKVLLQRQDAFRRNLVDRVLTYALGRGMEKSDRPTIDRLAKELQSAGDGFATLLALVAKSEPFRLQKNKKR